MRGMPPRRLADRLARWAGELAPGTRDHLSAYDLTALYDRAHAAGRDDVRQAVQHWVSQLGPLTRDRLSTFDLHALERAIRGAPEPTRLDPTALGPPSRPEDARHRGFTGDACSACGSMAVVRAGTCATCQDCGAQTGCS